MYTRIHQIPLLPRSLVPSVLTIASMCRIAGGVHGLQLWDSKSLTLLAIILLLLTSVLEVSHFSYFPVFSASYTMDVCSCSAMQILPSKPCQASDLGWDRASLAEKVCLILEEHDCMSDFSTRRKGTPCPERVPA